MFYSYTLSLALIVRKCGQNEFAGVVKRFHENTDDFHRGSGQIAPTRNSHALPYSWAGSCSAASDFPLAAGGAWADQGQPPTREFSFSWPHRRWQNRNRPGLHRIFIRPWKTFSLRYVRVSNTGEFEHSLGWKIGRARHTRNGLRQVPIG